jgi:hypothetical protein
MQESPGNRRFSAAGRSAFAGDYGGTSPKPLVSSVAEAGRNCLCQYDGKGIIPGGSSFEVMPGHLIPSKEPDGDDSAARGGGVPASTN